MKYSLSIIPILFWALSLEAAPREPQITIYENKSIVSVTAKTRYKVYRLKLKEISRPLSGKVKVISGKSISVVEPERGRFFNGFVRGSRKEYGTLAILGQDTSVMFEDRRREKYIDGAVKVGRREVNRKAIFRFSRRSADIGQCHIEQGHLEQGHIDPQPMSYSTFSKAKSQSKEISITAIADYEFFSRFNLNSASKIENVFSFVQMIYAEELGINLRLNDIYLYDRESELLQSSDIVALLGTFRKTGNKISPWGRSDIFHLFTGKSMEPREYVGLAYLGSACTAQGRYSYGLTKYVSSPIFPIITAHEIAHNLNATHAFEGIMMGDLSSNPRSFSSESRDEIASFVEQSGSCLGPLGIEVDLDIGPMSTQDLFSQSVITRGNGNVRCSLRLYIGETKEALRIGVAKRRAYLIARREGVAPGTSIEFKAPFKRKGRSIMRLFIRGILSCGNHQRLHTAIKPVRLKGETLSDLVSHLRRTLSG